jgi:hypothetical protein
MWRMDKDTKEIVDTLNLILTRMATKDDIANMATKDDIAELRAELKGDVDSLRSEVQQGFASIHAETRDIRNRLDAIESELRNHSGYAKEIDHLMERVSAIEKHLGIRHKIAA